MILTATGLAAGGDPVQVQVPPPQARARRRRRARRRPGARRGRALRLDGVRARRRVGASVARRAQPEAWEPELLEHLCRAAGGP